MKRCGDRAWHLALPTRITADRPDVPSRLTEPFGEAATVRHTRGLVAGGRGGQEARQRVHQQLGLRTRQGQVTEPAAQLADPVVEAPLADLDEVARAFDDDFHDVVIDVRGALASPEAERDRLAGQELAFAHHAAAPVLVAGKRADASGPRTWMAQPARAATLVVAKRTKELTMLSKDLSGVITTTPEEQCMAHRAVLSMILMLLAKKKIVNRQIIERGLQRLIDTGPEARMTPGVLEELDLVRFMMRALLEADEPVH